MNRLIRIELRRSAAPVAAIVLVLCAAGPMYATFESWGGRWMPLALDHRSLLYLDLPLVLGFGAWQGRRESRTGAAELLATTARPTWWRVTPTAVALAAASVAGHLLTFAVAAGWVAGSGGYVAPAVIPVVVTGAVAVAAGCWFGLAAGRALPRAYLPPLLATVALVALAVVPGLVGDRPGHRLALLSPVLERSYHDWDTVPGRLLAAHGALLAGLAAAGLLLATAASWRPRAAAVAVGAVAVLAAVPLLPPGGRAAAHVPDPRAYRLVCAEGTPRVCVTAVHAALLPGVVPVARQALGLLAKLPDAPTRAEEWHTVAGGPGGSGVPFTPGGAVLPVYLDVRAGRPVAPSLLDDLLDGAGTDFRPCPWNRGNVVARRVAGAWLRGAPPRAFENRQLDSDLDEDYRRLLALSPAERTARVAALRGAALRCDDDLRGVLAGRTAP